ncbi:MAG: Beta-hydroxyacyl-(acyl-carrier-protein) dehydratase FabA/FabZ [Bacteroidetes bacterium]|nr:Beta-hydroxyacyl-(acyl-carrier-protein) dehydratase FabA/FabZ [Bacteroidota bacterium]
MKTDPKFLNDLYVIKDIREELASNKFTVLIELNSNHPIFRGHFPGNPVLPGVCTVQIIKELLANLLKRNLNLKKAGTIKYLSFINPEINRLVSFDLQVKEAEEGQLICNVSVFHETTVFCSFRGEWAEE